MAPAVTHTFPPWPLKVLQLLFRKSLWDAGEEGCAVVFTISEDTYAKFTSGICVTSCFWRDAPSLGGTIPYMPLCTKSLPFPRSFSPFFLRKQVVAGAYRQCYGTRSPWTQGRKIHYRMESNVPPTLHWSALLQMMSTSKAGGLHRCRKRSHARWAGSRSALLKSIYTMTRYCCCCCCDCIVTAEFSQLSWDQDTPYTRVKQTAKNHVFQIPHANTRSWSGGATADFSIWLPLLNGLHAQLLAEVLPERCSRWGKLEKVITPRRIVDCCHHLPGCTCYEKSL